MSKLIQEAKATLSYTINNQKELITIGGKSAKGKSQKDWEISFALNAGHEASKKHGVPLETIAFIFINFVIVN